MSLLTWYHYGIYNLNLLWQKEKVSDNSFSNKNLLREVIQKFQVFHLLFQVPFAWMPFNVGFTFGSISPVLKIFSLHLKKKKKVGNPCGGHWGLALLANVAASWISKKSNIRNRLLETEYQESFHTKPVLTHRDFFFSLNLSQKQNSVKKIPSEGVESFWLRISGCSSYLWLCPAYLKTNLQVTPEHPPAQNCQELLCN